MYDYVCMYTSTDSIIAKNNDRIRQSVHAIFEQPPEETTEFGNKAISQPNQPIDSGGFHQYYFNQYVTIFQPCPLFSPSIDGSHLASRDEAIAIAVEDLEGFDQLFLRVLGGVIAAHLVGFGILFR